MQLFERGASAINGSLSASQRKAQIQTLRGLACILVVVYHVGGSDELHGIQISANSSLATLNHLLAPVRMPLFTFISGYVYAMRPITTGQEWPFLLRKFRRLLVPMCVVSLIFLAIQDALPDGHFALPLRDAWRIAVFPYAHFWYLQALTLIFASLVVIERCHMLSAPSDWFAVLTASIVAYWFINIPTNFFSANTALYLMPFFILGIGFWRFPEMLQNQTVIAAATITAVAGLIIYDMTQAKILSFSSFNISVLQLTVGMSACIVLFSTKFEWAPLAVIGSYSYSIYLFHIFGTAGARIVLIKAGIDNLALIFIAALSLGIILPIVVDALADRSRIARLLLLGRRSRQQT